MREQKEQEKQNELLRVVAEQNHERLIEYDVKEDRAVVYAIENDRFEVLFDIEDYVKKNHYGSVFIDPEDKKVFRRAMHACLQKEGTVTVDVRYCEKENQPEWYRFYLVSIAEEDGKTDRMVGRFCCVQQEKAITERMRRRAEIDVLTNVYNHKAFEEYCAKELAECTTNALFVMLDIDDFKMINDTQGHAVGDMVLSQTGSILSEVTGDRGIVGRLGGDEFAVFASGFQNSVEMEEFCVSLRENLKKIIFDMEYSVSIGAAKLDGRRISFPDFYYEADRAVYAAKRGGKNRIVFYDQIKENHIAVACIIMGLYTFRLIFLHQADVSRRTLPLGGFFLPLTCVWEKRYECEITKQNRANEEITAEASIAALRKLREIIGTNESLVDKWVNCSMIDHEVLLAVATGERLVEVLIYLLSKIIIEKNAQSISMVKILGYTNGEISKLYIMSTSLVVVFCLLLSLPLETVIMKVLFREMMLSSISGWITLWIDPMIYVQMFAAGIITYGIVALLEFRRVKKVPMDEALKNVE